MAFFPALALVVALSVDSLGVGAAYGLRGIRLPWTFYAVAALCTGALMGLSVGVGSHLAGCLAPVLARRVGGVVLVGVGLWQLYQGWCSYRRGLARPGQSSAGPRPVLRLGIRSLGLVVQILVEPVAADVDRSGAIEPAESLAVGAALGLDSLGAGLGAAMAGFPLAVVPFVAASCAAFAWLGVAVGRRAVLAGLVQRGFAVPGALLVILGLLRF